MEERSTCENFHKPKTSVDIRPTDQVLCNDCWKSRKVDKCIWNHNEDTDEDRNDISLVIKTTTSDQSENREEETEKPGQEEGSQSKGNSAIVDKEEGLNKVSRHEPEKDGPVSESHTQSRKCVKCDQRVIKGS